MVLYSSGQIVQANVVEAIVRFDVVFITPVGLCLSLEEAQTQMERMEIDPLTIKPAVMAVGTTLRELCL